MARKFEGRQPIPELSHEQKTAARVDAIKNLNKLLTDKQKNRAAFFAATKWQIHSVLKSGLIDQIYTKEISKDLEVINSLEEINYNRITKSRFSRIKDIKNLEKSFEGLGLSPEQIKGLQNEESLGVTMASLDPHLRADIYEVFLEPLPDNVPLKEAPDRFSKTDTRHREKQVAQVEVVIKNVINKLEKSIQ